MNRKRSLISETFRVKKRRFGADSLVGNPEHEDAQGAFTSLLRNRCCAAVCSSLTALAVKRGYLLDITLVLLRMPLSFVLMLIYLCFFFMYLWAEGPRDVKGSLQYLMTLFPRKLFDDSLPQIVYKHQLYSLLSDRTLVDKQLVMFFNIPRYQWRSCSKPSRSSRPVCCDSTPHPAHEPGLFLPQDFACTRESSCRESNIVHMLALISYLNQTFPRWHTRAKTSPFFRFPSRLLSPNDLQTFRRRRDCCHELRKL